MINNLPSQQELAALAERSLARCGVDPMPVGSVTTASPINGEHLSAVPSVGLEGVARAVERADEAFHVWRSVPAPARGLLVKRLGELIAENKVSIASLISLEAGKITSEAMGEVQEMIDICDFAVGLSRQLYGRTIASERPGHRLMETWHPLGIIGVISAFNFPAAVWSWNTAVALVCGDAVLWKPSELTPLTTLACQALLERAIAETGAPEHIAQVVLGGAEVGEALVDNPMIALVSATGSTAMGRIVGPRVAARFGRSLLELGGNNAAIVAESADLDLAVRGLVFAGAGTAGQRCTTLRRILVHRSVADELADRMARAYRRLSIGNPLDERTLVGPLIHGRAWGAMEAALASAARDGGEAIVGGGRIPAASAPNAFYVEPTIVRVERQAPIVLEETFAPLVYLIPVESLEEGIQLNNAAPQGLSSSIFTSSQSEAEMFMSAEGSDCGIVNVNIGTSGAEIGGAFGGEKETGGGRESGSDAWKAYMRRATNTVNFSGELPLAQGVDFSV